MSGRDDDNNNNNVTDNYSEKLLLAIRVVNDERVKLLLQEGANINQKDKRGNTALHYAAKHGFAEMVTLLLDNKANINQPNNNGWTPLWVAAETGKIEVVKLLLDNGANANPVDTEGNTPLHYAAYNGHTETCKLLLENGAGVNQANEYEETPLHQAAERGKIEVAKLLLDNEANIHAEDKYGYTPLYKAARKGHTEIVKLLLDNGYLTNLNEIEKSRVPRGFEGVKTCIICMESFSFPNPNLLINHLIVRTPCGHLFHKECLQRWMNMDQNPTCPKCREPLIIGVNQMGNHFFGNDKDGYRLCKNIVNNLKF